MAKRKKRQGVSITEWITAISNLLIALAAIGTLIVLISQAIK